MEPRIEAMLGQVRDAVAARRPLCIRAGGTKDFYGNPPRGEVLDPRGWQGIIDYDPGELFVTARAGTPLVELEAELDRHGQMLGFEPPHFGAGATLGGCVAAGLAGPRRCASGPAQGALRDSVLGARLLDGRGRVLALGGTVIKNVAGFDLSRTLAGSMGVLGVILEATLKVLPRTPAEVTLRFAMNEAEAICQLNRWAGQPLPLSASFWHQDVLWLRLSGAGAAVSASAMRLAGERVDEAVARDLWRDVREQRHSAFAGEASLWRFSLPSTAAPLALEGRQAIEWNGAQRWLRSGLPPEVLRARAQQLGGHATLFRAADRRAQDVFTPLSKSLAAIQGRLQDEFDPARIFNPGRMYPEQGP
jgi:glycolate oxidase FAD binding subunit